VTPLAKWAGRGLVAGLVLMFALNAASIARNWSSMKQVTTPRGTTAPDFDLPLLAGRRATLAGARGKPLVLAFWATWCGPCKAELPSLDRVQKRFPGVQFLAVNVEDAAMRPSVEAFVRATGLELPVALEGGPTSHRYHVDAIPHTVVLDAEGVVREVLSGMHSEAAVADAIAAAARPR
jgi:thiol-disulfide isomerase/thioredoxin